MRSTKTVRTKRTLIALLLMFVLSFSTVFADSGIKDEGTAAEGKQTETSDEDKSGETAKPAEESAEEEPEPEARIIRRGKYYYYRSARGAIRKKAGFVTVNDEKYYVQRGGRIKTSSTFKVDNKFFRANRYGVIMTGVYMWKGYYNFSYTQGQWRRREGFVVWKGRKYYIQKGGRIKTNEGFIVRNTAYIANRNGCVRRVELPEEDDNKVIEIAREQVGIMTGKTYWVWYYKTRFVDTDRTPWCGAFVAWCYNEAGLYKKISVARRFGPLGYVPSYSWYADRYNKWINKRDARAGDIIIFGRNRHVALVEGIYGNFIVTIEGNAGPTAAFGCGKPGAVVRKIYRLNDKDIKGVICVLRHRKNRS